MIVLVAIAPCLFPAKLVRRSREQARCVFSLQLLLDHFVIRVGGRSHVMRVSILIHTVAPQVALCQLVHELGLDSPLDEERTHGSKHPLASVKGLSCPCWLLLLHHRWTRPCCFPPPFPFSPAPDRGVLLLPWQPRASELWFAHLPSRIPLACADQICRWRSDRNSRPHQRNLPASACGGSANIFRSQLSNHHRLQQRAKPACMGPL